MERKQVESSQIRSIGHDPATSKLHIEFIPRGDAEEGAVYEYDNVDTELHAGFFAKDEKGEPVSIGRYFNQNIKGFADKFPYRKLPAKTKP